MWFEESASSDDETQPRIEALFPLTVLLAFPFIPLLLVWWTFWVVLQFLAKITLECFALEWIHRLLNVKNGPVR